MTTTLGTFTAAELRAGGVDRRGLLQPLLPDRGRVDPPAEDVVGGTPWLTVSADGVRAVGALATALQMTAVARTVVIEEMAGGRLLRYLFGRIGVTTHVLELCVDDPDRYLARLTTEADAAAVVASSLPDLEELVGSPAPGSRPPAALLAGDAPTLATVSSLSVHDPELPPFQQRVTVAAADGAAWLVLGSRHDDDAALAMAPLVPGRLESVVCAMLGGRAATL